MPSARSPPLLTKLQGTFRSCPSGACLLVLLLVVCFCAIAVACLRQRAVRETFAASRDGDLTHTHPVGITYTCLQDAIRSLYSQRTMHRNFGKKGSLPLSTSRAVSSDIKASKCPGPGKRQCFLADDDLEVAKHIVENSESQSYAAVSENSRPRPSIGDDTDHTLFYVDLEGIVHIRQNQSRCATVETARQHAANDGGTSHESSECYNPDSLFQDNRCPHPAKLYRSDLKMCVDSNHKCHYPSLGTQQASMFGRSYEKACPTEASRHTAYCEEQYSKDELVGIYYTPVFPYTTVELVKHAKHLQELLRSHRMFITLDANAKYEAVSAGDVLGDYTGVDELPGLVLGLDYDSDPSQITITHNPETPTDDPYFGDTKHLRALVFITCKESKKGEMNSGVLEMSDLDSPDDIRMYQFVVVPADTIYQTVRDA